MKLGVPLLKLLRQYDATTLASEVMNLPASAWIPHPGRVAGNDAVPLITPGGQITNAFTGPMAATDHLRSCPYIMEIMADIGAVWGRSRLMGLAAGSVVPEHVDVGYYWRTHLRIHIPIVTTPQVIFRCDGSSVHMAAGECWAFDSFCLHDVRNGGPDKRIHLVLDTVGGGRLWEMIEDAKRQTAKPYAVARHVPGESAFDALSFERVNAPEIMSPWEIRCHVDFLLKNTPAGHDLTGVADRLEQFINSWAAGWAQFGATHDGIMTYRRLIQLVTRDLKTLSSDRIILSNDAPFDRVLNELVFMVAVPEQPTFTAAAMR